MSEANFNNFHLANVNVYELAGGVIPELAERVGIPLGTEPNSQDLNNLWTQLRPQRELRLNPDIDIDREVGYELVERSGIQLALRRSLHNPNIGIENVRDAVSTGAVLNWQNRSTQTITRELPTNVAVHLPTGNRLMDTVTEKDNPWVKAYFEEHESYPPEWKYAGTVVMLELLKAGYDLDFIKVHSRVGDDIADALFEHRPYLAEQQLMVVRVANAGLQLAAQIRRAARKVNAGFDSDPTDPQLFIVTDEFPLARDEAEDSQPTEFQKLGTALQQLVLNASVVHELATSE